MSDPRLWTLLIAFLSAITGARSVVAQPAQSREASCVDIDFSADLGEVRDQGDTDLCFAFTVADLIGHKMGLKPPEKVSALDISANYYLSAPDEIWADARRNKDFNFRQYKATEEWASLLSKISALHYGERLGERGVGNPTLASRVYRTRQGACLESKLPSQGVNNEKRDFIAHSIHRLEQATGFRLDQRPKPRSKAERDGSFDPSSISQVYNLQTFSDTEKPCPPFQTPLTPNLELLATIANQRAAESVRMEINRLCEPRLPLPAFREYAWYVPEQGTGHELLNEVADELLDKRKPVGINYDSCFLKKNETGFATMNEKGELKWPSQRSCSHVSSLVGRRWNKSTKRCEYKIRNSWGPDCSIYKRGLDCEKGHVWVDESELAGRLTGTFLLDSSYPP